MRVFLFTVLILTSACNGLMKVDAELSVGKAESLSPRISYSGSQGNSLIHGSTFNVTPSVLNSAKSCSISPTLPSGLSLNTATCVITGTAASQFSQTFTVTAVNEYGSTEATFLLESEVYSPTISYPVTSSSYGSSLSVTPSVLEENGGAITSCTSTPALPTGLSIDPITCEISGSTTVIITSQSFLISTTNSAGSSSTSFVLTIQPIVPSISYAGATGTSGSVGVAMSVSPTTLNNNGAAITNCVATPALTVGLSINTSTCVISGTPTGTLASTAYSVVATNSAGSSAAASVTLSVATSVPTLSYAGATGLTGTVGSAMSVSPTTLSTNGAAISSCTVSPTLPAGLSIDNISCIISGTPSAILNSTSFTVSASNSAGTSSSAVSLIINASAPAISYLGASGTSGIVATAMNVAPTILSDNGAPLSSCTISPDLPTGLSIDDTTCVISGTPSGVLAATEYSITATNSAGNSSAASVTLSVCPTNYALVPANPGLGLHSAFCVAQFEMKCVGTSCPTATPGANAVATSQATGTPWVSINQTNSKTACTNLNAINGVTDKYDLISNPEWMTIAHEIEKTAANWSGVTPAVGVGRLNRGHSDNSPDSALAVTDTNNPYNGTGNNSGQAVGSGWEQKRTHTLSNGQIIWDIAGNVWEWTDWSLGGGLTSGPKSCASAWTQFPDVSCGALAAADYMPDNPASVTAANYNTNYGLGEFYGGAGGAALRGGRWDVGMQAGAFTLRLDNALGNTNTNPGFRCVFRP